MNTFKLILVSFVAILSVACGGGVTHAELHARDAVICRVFELESRIDKLEKENAEMQHAMDVQRRVIENISYREALPVTTVSTDR